MAQYLKTGSIGSTYSIYFRMPLEGPQQSPHARRPSFILRGPITIAQICGLAVDTIDPELDKEIGR